MRAKIIALLVAVAMTVSVASAGHAPREDEPRTEETVYEHAVAEIEAEFGEIPETATTLDGETVPADEALERFRESLDGMAAPSTPRGGGGTDDTGVGVRPGSYLCETAVVFRAVAIGFDAPSETLINEEVEGVEDGTDPCTGQTVTAGTATAEVNPDPGVDFRAACVSDDAHADVLGHGTAGGWLSDLDENCHFSGFSEATVHGRVVSVTFGFCFGDFCIVNEQIRGGFATPVDEAGEQVEDDVAVIEVGDGALP